MMERKTTHIVWVSLSAETKTEGTFSVMSQSTERLAFAVDVDSAYHIRNLSDLERDIRNAITNYDEDVVEP